VRRQRLLACRQVSFFRQPHAPPAARSAAARLRSRAHAAARRRGTAPAGAEAMTRMRQPTRRAAAGPTRRAFLVGCPRSGTTFLQAALSSHPEILSLPETAFFERLLPERIDDEVFGAPRPARLRQRGREYLRVQRRAPRLLRRVLAALDVEGVRPGRHLGLSGYAAEFVRLLDAAARARGCRAWLEKTPNHVFYVDVIERHVPDARFIHLLRRGEDVVASAVEASLRYADLDEGRAAFGRDISWWVACWNAAVATHDRYAGRDNHCIVFYEDLVDDFEREYARLCAFVGVAPRPVRLDAAKRVARLEREPWKREALSGQVRPAARKFDALFGPAARRWIRARLHPYDDVRERLGGDCAGRA